jgi:hypothetical protein
VGSNIIYKAYQVVLLNSLPLIAKIHSIQTELHDFLEYLCVIEMNNRES